MEYRVWTIVEGACEDDEDFASASERDARADALAAELRQLQGTDWEVWTANVTEGCLVGEWAGEEGTIVASSETER